MTRYSHYVLALWLIAALAAAFAAAKAAPQAEQPDVIDGFSGNYLSGQYARSSGDIATAIQYLEKSHADNPENDSIVKELQGMLLLEGKVGDAVGLAADGNDESAFSGLLMAIQYIKDNQLDDAGDVLDKLADSDTPQLWQPLLADWAALSQQKPSKPFSIDDFPSDIGAAAPFVNYHLALLNEAAGFNDAAAQNFHDAVTEPKTAPERVMRRMIAFYQSHNKPGALAPIVKTYLETHPAFHVNAPMPVVATAQDGAAEVMFTLGGIMLGSGETTDAVIYLQLAQYLKPNANDILLALGDAYGSLGQYARANEAYQRISMQSPFYSKAQLHLAVNEDSMGKTKEALARLDILAKRSASASDALITKGDLLRLHARYHEAAASYAAGLKLLPSVTASYWPVLFARGACLERLGKWDEAKRELQAALKLKPNQPDVLNYLGYGMIEHHEELPQASDMIAEAVKERPDDPQILDSMGWALYLRGEYAKAAIYAEKAVDLLPDDATVNDHLGDVYWRTGRKVEARYQWQRSLNFSPEARMTGSIEEKLKSGLPPIVAAAPKVATRASDIATQ